ANEMEISHFCCAFSSLIAYHARPFIWYTNASHYDEPMVPICPGNTSSIYYWLAILRSEEHTSELQSRFDLVCRLLLEKKKRPSRAAGRCGRRRWSCSDWGRWWCASASTCRAYDRRADPRCGACARPRRVPVATPQRPE